MKDVKEVAKLADPYTEIKELYKNLKTNQNPNFIRNENGTSPIFNKSTEQRDQPFFSND